MPLPARAALLLLTLASSPALACPVPAFFEMPWFAEITLANDYGLDPFAVPVKAGGVAELSGCHLEGEGLTGYTGDGRIDSRPDVVLHWLGEAPNLAFTTDMPEDSLLVVLDPEETWHFNEDDGEGQNPLVVIPDPLPGDYVIFVGSYSEGGTDRGELIITQPRT